MKLRKNNKKILFNNKVIFNLSVTPGFPKTISIRSLRLPSNIAVILAVHGIICRNARETNAVITAKSFVAKYTATGYPGKSLL